MNRSGTTGAPPLANDPLNLMSADGPANMQKSDSSAGAWLPANKAYWCEYIARQTAVKAKYDLSATQPEHDAIAGILASCKLVLQPPPANCVSG